ncbi:MAG: 4-(cytidine 5'-diphospho)-2-C-methyl-D-erythritol kinase [Clostridia bacterium]|nr:4-(cytidine 5'-diphospho)-2-C-methyl-D-erythritol kinase [Clostridia bacterium]
MKTVRIKSYAKVNLTLEITGAEGGYHFLDSLVASVNLFDLIVLKKRKDPLCSVTMKGLGSESIPPDENNALKAGEAFAQAFGTGGADITVYKNIPLGAGLGGSSADAAGVLVGMAKLYGVDEPEKLAELADALGSDIRYMLKGGFARMQGRGEKVTPLPITEKLHFLMICPSDGVSSGACYRKYDGLNAPKTGVGNTEKCIQALRRKDISEAGRYLTNDLYPPAAELCEDVQKAYEAALSFSPLGAVMTGSGSCVLAVFENREFCEWAKSRYKGKARTIVAETVLPEKMKKGWRSPFALSEEERKLLDNE